MRVLLVEDDTIVARSIELMLNAAGFNVYIASTGEDGIDLAKNFDYDIVMLDMHLPDMNGLNVIQTIRNAKIAKPILILSGDQAVDVRVRALSLGADDFMTKPFHKAELVARLHAVARRANAHTRSLITIGEIELDLDAQAASAAGIDLALTTKEYQMLEALCLRKGMTLSKDVLLNQLYGGMDEPEPKIIDVFICKLRKKIQIATRGRQYIRTVWGRGYQLCDPQEQDSMAA